MWRSLSRIFKRPEQSALTLEQKVSIACDDRELVRLAAEALRAQQPQHAHVAYWKAVQLYTSQQHHLKALGILNTILRFAPNDGNAHLMRIQTLEHLGRWRDASGACLQAGQLFWAYGDRERASWLLARAQELDPPVVSVAPVEPQVIVGTPEPELASSQTGVIELDIEPPSAELPAIDHEAGTIMMDALDEPEPDPDLLANGQTCMAMEAIPSSLVGTEHEEIARGYLASTIPENATRAYDQSELAALLDEADAA